MNWFNEYLIMNNRNSCGMTGDNPMFPWQMMGMPNPMFMPGQMMDECDSMHGHMMNESDPMPGQMMGGSDPMPGQMMGGFNPMHGQMMGGFNPMFHGSGFFPFGFFFLPIHHHHHHHHRQNRDFDENMEECSSNAYPYIIPYH